MEDRVNSVEDENKLLRDYNEQFGDENNRLIGENDSLKKEIARYRNIRIPKRSKSCQSSNGSPDEQDENNARVRFFMVEFCYLLMKFYITTTFLFIFLGRNEEFIEGSNTQGISAGLRQNVLRTVRYCL